MNYRTTAKNRSGVTLIELILVVALLSVIVTTAFNFQIFNLKIYNKSDNLSKVQFDVRMASDYITTNIRNANSISTTDATLDDYIDISILQNKFNLVNYVEFEITRQGGQYFVSYLLQGADSKGNNDYELRSEVFVDNITSAIPTTGTTIYFTK